jgi:hypothetical protein
VAYYRFGEPAGASSARDWAAQISAAYRNVDAGQTGAIAGDMDTAIHLHGAPDSDVFLDDRFDFAGKASFSFEVWLKPAIVDAETRQILGKTGANGGYVFVFNTNGLIFYRNDTSSNNADLVTIPMSSFPIGSYRHVVVTFDGVALALKSYLDGAVSDSAPAMASLPDTTSPLVVGEGFEGDLDEFAIYDHALDPGRVSAHYRAGAGAR